MTRFDYEELMLTFSEMREQGWDAQLCDTPVPYYDGRVPCGTPCGVGDDGIDGYVMLPREVAELDAVYLLSVRGQSMRDAGIASGDKLEVLATNVANDGDIVVAYVDGAYTVKVFVTDERGQRWLVPRNPDYRPILLTEELEVRIMGRVICIRHAPQRESYATLIGEVRKEQERMDGKLCEQTPEVPTPDVPTPEELRAMLREVYGADMKSARDWIAVYRVLVDLCKAPEDFEGFARWSRGVMPDEFPNCTAEALRKGDTVYLRPLFDWTEERAAGLRLSKFRQRRSVAQRLRSMLKSK